MSYKPEESKLMDYLYGELSQEELQKIEAYLSENEDARKELESLKETQAILGKMNDREVEIPSFVFDDSSKVVVAQNAGFRSIWRRSLAIAASISIIILTGYLTNFKMTTGNGGVQLSFGTPTTGSSFSQQDVEAIVQQALVANNQLTEQKIKNASNEMMQFASANQTAIDRHEIDRYMARLNDRNIETLSGLLESSELAQRRYTEDLLQDFVVFLDVQRENDLNAIQTRFDNLTNDTRFNRLQTNQILTNLLSNEDQPSNQY